MVDTWAWLRYSAVHLFRRRWALRFAPSCPWSTPAIGGGTGLQKGRLPAS